MKKWKDVDPEIFNEDDTIVEDVDSLPSIPPEDEYDEYDEDVKQWAMDCGIRGC